MTDQITEQTINERVVEAARELLNEAGGDQERALEGVGAAVDCWNWVQNNHLARSFIDACGDGERGFGFDRLGDMGVTFGPGQGQIGTWGELCTKLAYCILDTLVSAAVSNEYEDLQELREDLQAAMWDWAAGDPTALATISDSDIAELVEHLGGVWEPYADILKARGRELRAEHSD